MVNFLKNESGMGFVDLIAAVVVSIIALSSMFLIIISSQIRVTQNYHYRKALLGALSKIEIIKYYNRNFTRYLNLSISDIDSPVTIDENYNPELKGNVKVESRLEYTLNNLPLYIHRYVVLVKVEWTEKSANLFHILKPKKQEVILREDYYFTQQSSSEGS